MDQCHHRKEEDIFFPTLEKKGIHTSCGPLGVMLMEHNRSLIQEMSEAAEAYHAGREDSGKRWSQAAWDYSDLLYDHFGKEEEVLFRMAELVPQNGRR